MVTIVIWEPFQETIVIKHRSLVCWQSQVRRDATRNLVCFILLVALRIDFHSAFHTAVAHFAVSGIIYSRLSTLTNLSMKWNIFISIWLLEFSVVLSIGIGWWLHRHNKGKWQWQPALVCSCCYIKIICHSLHIRHLAQCVFACQYVYMPQKEKPNKMKSLPHSRSALCLHWHLVHWLLTS